MHANQQSREFQIKVGFDGSRGTDKAVKHETLFHNADVRAAGELEIEGGVILEVGDISGTYGTQGRLQTDHTFADAVLRALDGIAAPIDAGERRRLEKKGRAVMTWKMRDMDRVLDQDVDDAVEKARSLEGKDRTAALRDSLETLERSGEPLIRLKILLFIQTLLAGAADRKLASSVAEPVVNELVRVVVSASDQTELKRAALDGLALLFLKAKELTSTADARVRTAFTAARDSQDRYLSDFARRALEDKGVLSRRVVQRQYRHIYVSVGTAVGTLSAAGALGYLISKKARKTAPSGRKRSRSAIAGRSSSHKTTE